MSHPTNSITAKRFSVIGFCVLLISLVAFSIGARAQNFNYTISHDSVGWQGLTSQTICNTGNTALADSYRIGIGFPFKYLGKTFDSLTIQTTGYLLFGNNNQYSFMAFNNFGDYVNAQGNHSVLGYERSGSGNTSILKIQYQSISRRFSKDDFSYQLWLHADGRIQLITGSSALSADSSFYSHVGLVNRLMDTPNRGLLLKGQITAPLAQPVNDQYPDLPYMMRVPIAGHRYTFIPPAN
jgi:hypothetical protein